MNKNFELMFTSTGSLFLSLFYGSERAYVHAYDDMQQAAGDLNEFFSLEFSVALWEGNLLNDDEFDPFDIELNPELERNGEFFWAMDIEQVRKSIQIHSWTNVQDFMAAWEALTSPY